MVMLSCSHKMCFNGSDTTAVGLVINFIFILFIYLFILVEKT